MRKLFVIGIGAGDPDQVTVAAIKAMRAVDVFFVIGKGETKRELVEVRTRILREHVGEVRIVEVPDPPRDRAPADYAGVVDDWHDRRAALLAERFAAVDGVGGILVWGDPSLYDSTLRVVDRVREQHRGVRRRGDPGHHQRAGIGGAAPDRAQPGGGAGDLDDGATAARGRGLSGDAVVMLDAGTAFEDLDPRDADLVGRLPGTAGRDAGRGDGRGGRGPRYGRCARCCASARAGSWTSTWSGRRCVID